MFERLFGNGGTNEQRAAQARQDRSILDFVGADFARLTRELGPADRVQVDEYLESVREVERRIQTVERLGDDAGLPALERPPGIPETFGEHVKLMYELQWLAFQADLTRVVTFMLGRELNFRTYPEIGLTQGHHTMSHHQEKPENIERYAKLNTYQTDLFASFLSKLASTPEGDGTLLDHSMFLYGGAFGNPNLHAHIDLPLTLVGGPAGRPGGGQHRVEPSGTPMSNLLLDAARSASTCPLESLGDSTGRVELASAECVSARRLLLLLCGVASRRGGRSRLVARGRKTERRRAATARRRRRSERRRCRRHVGAALGRSPRRPRERVGAARGGRGRGRARIATACGPRISPRRTAMQRRCARCSKPARIRTRCLPRARRC